ncbi:MAG: PAS domain-containing protein, partial [Thermoplasmata archaeon]
MTKKKGRAKTGIERVKTASEAADSPEDSEEILSSIFNAITDGMSVIDRDYKVIMANNSLAHLYGYKGPEDIIGKKCYSVYHSKRKRCAECPAHEVFRTAKPQHTMLRRKDIHGSDIFFEIYSYPIFDSKGTVMKVVDYAKNITKEKVLEEEVRETERKLAEVLSVSRDVMVEVDSSMRITFITENVKEFLGHSAGEIIGKNFIDFIAPDIKKMVIDNFKRRVAGKKVPSLYEISIVRKDGWIIPVEINVSLRKRGSKVLGIVATARDITERKKVEEALVESEKRFRTLFERSPISVTLVDTTGVVTDCNASTEKLIGYSKKEIVGKRFDKLLTMHREDLPKIMKRFKRLSEGKPIKPYELKIIRKNAEERWVEVSSTTVKVDEEIVGFQISARDITERKEMMMALRESEE